MEGNFYRRFCRRFFGGALITLFLVSPSFSQGPAEKTETLSIKKIEVTESTEGSRVSIEGSKPFEHTVFKLVNPLRVVVDLPQAKLGKLVGPIKVQSGAVNVIQNKQIEDPRNPRARIEIGLDRLVEYNATSEGNYLYIDFGKPPALLAKEIKKEQEVKKEEPQAEKPLSRGRSVTDVTISTKPNIVEVEIKGDGPMPDYRSYQLARPPRLVIDLPKMVNVSTKKNIDVGSQLLQNIRLGETPEKLRVVLTFPGTKLPPYKVTKEGQDLKVILGGVIDETVRKETAPAAEPAKPIRVAEAEPKKATEAAAPPPAEKPPVQEKEPPAETKPALEAERSQAAQYRGARLSLDFKDADLRDIFRLIADVSNLNIIYTDDVKGKITIRMVNVPWDQALDVILSTKNLIKIEEGNVLRITTMENVRKDREEKQKEEDILIKSRESKEKLETLSTETIVVNYAKAADLQKLIREKDDKGKGFLGPRGSVKADERTNTLILQDSRAQIEEIQNLVKKLDTPTPQVLIEARIVQAVTTFARSLGVQWGGSYNQTGVGWHWGLTGNNPAAAAGWGFNPATGTPLVTPSNFVVNFPASTANTPVGGMGISFGKLTGNLVNLDLRIQLGETEGQTKVIARPKLATLTNQEAVIKQGEKIPYETTSQAGTQVQFIDAVLSLKVTPQVTPDGTIMMKVAVTRDARGSFRSPVNQVPSIDNREASTQVLVKEGETIVIGGIYESESAETQSGIPWLMKIPVLGWLFKNQEVISTKKELLIFITPTLMQAKAGS
ncbi:MAG: type IV pilus secretin PilQ [Thermodesulfobacteriota bacterium]|nr:type IV pilus secretin PilQ [Thermodesulfobacteriota bacterium]